MTSCVYANFTLLTILCLFCKLFRIVRVYLAPRSSCESILTLLQIVRYLKEELKWVKEDNEQILKEQEELNNVMLTKLYRNDEDKNKGPKLNMEITAPYKLKLRKLEF